MENLSRLVVLVSGNGTNLQAILDACQTGILPARVVGVISNKAEAYGLVRAQLAEAPTLVLEKSKQQDRRDYDQILAEKVAAFSPDWIILAGWMRILTSVFLDRFPNQVINLHPALPGTFPGAHAIQRAYAAWENGETDRSGVMVHLVPDEDVDAGPILAVDEILFDIGETLEEFEQRVHIVEHRLLVETLEKVLAHPEVIAGMRR